MKTYLETFIDLHIHTQSSDGTWAPDDVVENVKNANIEIFAVTDHDSIDNVKPTQIKAEKAGIKCIAGVELSTTYNKIEHHILAYDFQLDHPSIVNRININNKQRKDYHLTVINKLLDHVKNI